MLWWWKLQLESPEGATRQQAIEELAGYLEHRSFDRQRNAANLLASIGHPLAVRWSLQYVVHRECSESCARLLERMVDTFAHVVETESLKAIAALSDPLQKVNSPRPTPGQKRIPAAWETLRAIDCSSLRRKAAAELKRRADAESKWQKADEELKQTRQHATLVLVKGRKSA
jgi:hypothetical protein